MKTNKNGEHDPAYLHLCKSIESVDERILATIAQRMSVAKTIGIHKAANNLPIRVPEVEKARLARVVEIGKKHGLSEELVYFIWIQIFAESRRLQRIERKKTLEASKP